MLVMICATWPLNGTEQSRAATIDFYWDRSRSLYSVRKPLAQTCRKYQKTVAEGPENKKCVGVGSILLERSRICTWNGRDIWKSTDSSVLSMAPKQVAYVFGVPKERWHGILSDDSIDIHQSTQKFEKGRFWGGLLIHDMHHADGHTYNKE